MEREEIFNEFERIAKAFQAPDQDLELDIQKIINCLRTEASVPKADEQDLDEALHHPEKLTWVLTANLPEESKFVPNDIQIEFFRNMTAKATEGMIWEIPTTGQVYRVSPKSKTFTLIKNTQMDKDDWHGRNRVILEKIGWTMVDARTTLRTYTSNHKNWLFVLSDFSIEDQESPKTPGKNHPPGSRGQDAFASLKTGGAFIRLSYKVGRAFMKHVSPDFGVGKFGSKLGNID